MKTKRERIFILNNPHSLRINGELAAEIGLNESIVLLQLEFLISISDNQRDGKFWTYQSVRDLQRDYFPWWGTATINRIINSLVEKELIIVSNYNQRKYDNTRWIALNYDGIATLKSVSVRAYQNDTRSNQNDTRSNQNDTRSNQDDTPIPETTTEITTEITTDVGDSKSESPTPPTQDALPFSVSDKDTVEATLEEDLLLFEAINQDRKVRRRRAARPRFDTIQQKARWREATAAARRLYNGQHNEKLKEWVNAALEKGITNKGSIIAYVARCAANQVERKETPIRLY